MKIILYIFFAITSISIYSQEQYGIIKVTDNAGRVDSVIFGDGGTMGIDESLGEVDLSGIPYDSLEIRSIMRDTMCAFYVPWLEYLIYDQNVDLKKDYRDAIGATLPSYSNFTFFVNAIDYPVTVEMNQFNFNLSYIYFINYDSLCETFTDSMVWDIDFAEIDTIFILTETSSPYLRVYPEVNYFKAPLLENKNEFEILPNPSRTNFFIKTEINEKSKAELKICNLYGQIIKEIKISSGLTEIKTKGWTKGTYVCNLFVNGRLVGSEKMIFE